MTSSFDIFDTCLLRKCGTPQGFFDVFSLHAFNGEVEEYIRQEFVAARYLAQLSVASPSMALDDIWNAFSWSHPQLKSKDELCQLEQETEREMLVPVIQMLEKVNDCRCKGHHIVFISDMYLSSALIGEVMRECGFMKDGDSLYVSCECNAEKCDGELFKYVREKEGLSFRRWHHYGDNIVGDFKAPHKLGIKSTLIKHEYTPFQKQWVENEFSLGFKTSSIMAGIGHALHYSTQWTTHTDFVLDIIAPFYSSLVFRMMKDAERRGIKRLYFCARDAYMMFLIAQKFQSVFPTIECKFLYISRKALYEGDDCAKIAYYESVGLATREDYVAIVDIRSTGKTLTFLNDYLVSKGYRQIRGYYYELFCGAVGVNQRYHPNDYYAELSDEYDKGKGATIGSVSHIFEVFFPLNVLPKTIGYSTQCGEAIPIFETKEECEEIDIDQVKVQQKEKWLQIHYELIMLYVEAFIQMRLYLFSDEVFRIANNTLFSFINCPNKSYLDALTCLYGKRWNTDYLSYVKKESWVRLLFTHGKDTIWKMGTLKYSNFVWFQKFYKRIQYGAS